LLVEEPPAGRGLRDWLFLEPLEQALERLLLLLEPFLDLKELRRAPFFPEVEWPRWFSLF